MLSDQKSLYSVKIEKTLCNGEGDCVEYIDTIARCTNEKDALKIVAENPGSFIEAPASSHKETLHHV